MNKLGSYLIRVLYNVKTVEVLRDTATNCTFGIKLSVILLSTKTVTTVLTNTCVNFTTDHFAPT